MLLDPRTPARAAARGHRAGSICDGRSAPSLGAMAEVLKEVELPEARQAVRFVACGDLQGFDSDASYTLPSDYQRREVLQSPVHGLFSH